MAYYKETMMLTRMNSKLEQTMELTNENFQDSNRLVRITNTTNPVSDNLRKTIDQSRTTVLQGMQKQEELSQAHRRPSRPSSLSQRPLDDVAKQLSNRDSTESWETWDHERSAWLDHIRSSPGLLVQEEPPYLFDVRHQGVAGVGEMWWAETNFILPDRLGLTLFWDEHGLRFSGALRHSSGDLWKGSLVVFSWFGLSTDRMPPGGTRFRSSPFGWLTGEVIGFTHGGGLLAGDQWSKCWLQASQVVHQGSSAIPAWAPHWNLLHITDDYDYETTFLPGQFNFPSIDFDLNRQLDVAIYTGLKFDFQLEGDAEFRFGGVGHMNPSLFQGSQWKLQPV